MTIAIKTINPQHLYTKQELAKKLRVSPGRISQLIKAKDDRVCSIKINGGTVMYHKDEPTILK